MDLTETLVDRALRTTLRTYLTVLEKRVNETNRLMEPYNIKMKIGTIRVGQKLAQFVEPRVWEETSAIYFGQTHVNAIVDPTLDPYAIIGDIERIVNEYYEPRKFDIEQWILYERTNDRKFLEN